MTNVCDEIGLNLLQSWLVYDRLCAVIGDLWYSLLSLHNIADWLEVEPDMESIDLWHGGSISRIAIRQCSSVFVASECILLQ